MTAFEFTHQHTADLHYCGTDNQGRRIILDAAEVHPNSFVVAVLRTDGEEIASEAASTLEEARSVYHKMFQRYVEPLRVAPLSGKYAKLRDDLRAALEAGRAAEEADPEDGGTCNLDASALSLPRWKEADVKRAAEEAGTGCFVWRLYGGKMYVFIPNSRSQGNARSRNAEAMTKSLAAMGYDAIDYCQMD